MKHFLSRRFIPFCFVAGSIHAASPLDEYVGSFTTGRERPGHAPFHRNAADNKDDGKTTARDERSIYKTEVFDFHKTFPSPCDDPGGCLTIKDMIGRSLELSYESRQAVEQLFQMRAFSKQKIGVMLPHLYTGITYTDLIAFTPLPAVLDIASSFVGFLFPNRWFDWKASRVLVEAEIESIKSLYGDRALIILTNYYSVQQQIWQIRVHTHYVEALKQLLKVMHYQNDNGLRRIGLEDFALFENIRGRQMYNLAFINNLTMTYPVLAYSMGMELNKVWTNFNVEPHAIVSTKNVPIGVPEVYYVPAEKNSTELANVRELIKAAKLNKKSNYFDIFDPASGNDLGFGYGQRIKVAEANVKILEIQEEKTLGQIRVNVNNYLNNYNDAIVALQTLEEVLPKIEDMRIAAEKLINDTTIPFDSLRVARYFETAYWVGLDYCGAYFMLKTNEVALDRLTWKGPYFKQILDYANGGGLAKAYAAVDKSHSFREAFKKFFRKIFKEKPKLRPLLQLNTAAK